MPRNSTAKMLDIQISVMPAFLLRGTRKGRDPVGDGLDAGEGRGAAGEGVKDQKERDCLGRLHIHRRRITHNPQRSQGIADQPDAYCQRHHRQKEIAGNGKC